MIVARITVCAFASAATLLLACNEPPPMDAGGSDATSVDSSRDVARDNGAGVDSGSGDVGGESDDGTPPDVATDTELDPAADVQEGDTVFDPDAVGEDTPDDRDADSDSGADSGGDTLPDTPVDTEPPPVLTVEITVPEAGFTAEIGTPIEFTGSVVDEVYGAGEIEAVWLLDDADTVLAVAELADDGTTTLTATDLEAGPHVVILEATTPDERTERDEVPIGVCTWESPETFDAEIEGGSWRVFGDASFDDGGWLEMTGNVQSRHGAIYNPVDHVNPGDVNISFRIWTGGGINGGADGFAMSIWNVVSEDALLRVVAAGQPGGCLGYGVSAECGSMDVEGFHIEIDTWENRADPMTDPTAANHIAITLDGDPGEHVLWAAIPGIEDSAWHDVTVEVNGAAVRVTLDGAEVIPETIVAGLEFKGGFIAFSGSTGWATNFHRFDDLEILQECLVR